MQKPLKMTSIILKDYRTTTIPMLVYVIIKVVRLTSFSQIIYYKPRHTI